MKSLLAIAGAVLILAACSQGDKKSSAQTKKDPPKPEHLLTKDGVGEIKVGMLQKDIEKLLGQPLAMKHAKDTGEVWTDTAVIKYRDMELELSFQRSYIEEYKDEMEVFAISTSSPLCKTAEGLGVGDDRDAILAVYQDNPINMGPESVMINDTTWGFSKTNYYINVNDDKWDRQITFLLVNKKVARLEAMLAMGE